jgi:hypothetical protein
MVHDAGDGTFQGAQFNKDITEENVQVQLPGVHGRHQGSILLVVHEPPRTAPAPGF